MIIVRKETYLIKRKRLQLVNILVWRQCWETLALFDFALVPDILRQQACNPVFLHPIV